MAEIRASVLINRAAGIVGLSRIIHTLNRIDDPELQYGADTGIVAAALEGLADGQGLVGLAAIRLLQQVHKIDAVARFESRKVNDNIIPLCHSLLIEFRQGNWVHDEVAIIRDKVEGHLRALSKSRALVDRERQLNEARHSGIQDPKTIPARQDFKIRVIGAIDTEHVAQEALHVKDIEVKLSLLGESRVRDGEVHIEIGVAPSESSAARQLQIDPVGEILATPVRSAIEIA
jgi:hypothetical protein